MTIRVGPAASGYRPDIDGLRAVAVAAVIGFHVFPRLDPGGFIGVDIFFVISGFLISTIILAARDQGRFDAFDFYSRRARRIFPALIIVLLASLAAGWVLLLAAEYRSLGKHVAAAAAFVANLALWRENGYFDIESEAKPLLHLWSLGVEEQFYLLWPVLLLFVARWGGRATALLTGGLALASFGYCVYATFAAPDAAFFSPVARWWELMAGGLLAQFVRQRGTLHGGTAEAASVAGAVLIAGTLVLLDEWDSFPGWWALAPVAGTALIVLAGPAAWINRTVLSHRLLVGCGLISYPLYLWHWPVLSFAQIWKNGPLGIDNRIGIIAVAIALAALTYLFVERPLRAGRLWRAPAAGLLTVMAAIAVIGLALYAANGVPWRPVVAQVRSPIVVDGRPDDPVACADGPKLPAVLAARCHNHINKEGNPRVILWGDSHGAVWSPVLEQLAVRDGFELYVFSALGCPPLAGVRLSYDRNAGVACDSLARSHEILDEILRLRPAVVVIAARWPLYLRGWVRKGELRRDNTYLTAQPGGPATPETSRQALVEAIPATVKRLQDAGIAVVILKNPPTLSTSVLDLRKSIADLEAPTADYRRDSRDIDDILTRLTGVDLVDPADTLCRLHCRVEDDGVYFYLDDNHLSVPGALLFEPEIGALLARRLKSPTRP